MNPLRIAPRVAALALAAALAAAGPAQAVLLTASNGSGLAGQNVDIPITVSSTTGLNIVSAQFDITYDPNVVTAIAVLTTGTLAATAGWQTPQWNVTVNASTGRIRISDAGNNALTGAGTLLTVRFLVNPTLLNGSSTALTPANVTFNEGTPAATTASGTLTVNVTPQISVSPTSGQVIRGNTLQFSVSGSVSPPVAWSTSDAAVATISATGLLTGVSPGSVTVTATDNAAHSNTTSGVVVVYGMGLTAGTSNVLVGQTVSVPITVTSLTGLGIRAGQVKLQFNPALVTATGVTTPGGTLLSGYGSIGFGAATGSCTFDFAGATDLAGSGVLCNVTFLANSTVSGFSGVNVTQALFNETLPALTTNGGVTVSSLPTITVNPDVAVLLAGQTLQYSLSGSPTPPITWSVVDPTVASISSTGLVTALKGGVTQVRAQDHVGAVDYSTSLTVYDFRVAPDTVTVLPGQTCEMRLLADRPLGPLGIYSLQYRIQWAGSYITSEVAKNQGLISSWSPNVLPVYGANSLAVTAAGTTPFASPAREIEWLLFTISPSTPSGTDIALMLSSLLCNEGKPSAQLGNGLIHVRNTTDVPETGAVAGLELAPPVPNPASSGARLGFVVPSGDGAGESVRLEILGLDGRHVRTLIDGAMPPGDHSVVWEGRDDAQRAVAPGLYFVRLQWHGESQSRKLAMVR